MPYPFCRRGIVLEGNTTLSSSCIEVMKLRDLEKVELIGLTSEKLV